MATRSTPPATSGQPNYTGPFIAVTTLFFIFGFITTLNMALVPYLRKIIDLPQGMAALATSAFFLAYFVFSTPAAKLIEMIGYKRTIVVSLFVQVVGCLMFIPAAKSLSFPFFLAAVFVLGAGVTALQTALNPYVTILGPESSAPARLTLAQAFNSLGTTIAPLVGGFFLLKETGNMDKTAIAEAVRIPYLAVAGALLILGVAVAFFNLPAVTQTQSFRPGKEGDSILNRSIWSFRHTVLAAVGIFLYVGVEVTLGTFAIAFFLTQGVPNAEKASFLMSFYWGGALVGRLLGSWMLTKIQAGKLLMLFGAAGTVMLIISMLTTGHVAVWAVILCGFCNSIMFPNIFALGVAGLGPLTSKGSGLITTAIVGGAVVPWVMGLAIDHFGGNVQHALFIPLICYIFIAYYGLSGHKQKTA
jgi:FHS family L-fucose permease-like MFS transporter